MKIAGLAKTSFVDYPGKIAAVIFTQGCNYNCFYCHNRQLISLYTKEALHEEKDVLEFLSLRKGFLEGVVITGGEPTLQEDLPEFLKKLRKMDYAIKLDTNGSHPEMLRIILSANLADYVAMDIKAPQDLYERICQVKVNTEALNESISLLIHSQKPHEFRTTWAPGLSKEDIKTIINIIPPDSLFYLQEYRNPDLSTSPVTDTNKIAIELTRDYPNCRLRGF
jgi:pyruvate formate lyase activating enzyme